MFYTLFILLGGITCQSPLGIDCLEKVVVAKISTDLHEVEFLKGYKNITIYAFYYRCGKKWSKKGTGP